MQNNEQQQQSATGSRNERISEGISDGVQQPTDDDVLCGKSNACLHHVGSKRFREYLETYVEAYAQATTKYEKMQLTKEIYSNLRKKSRFLKYNKKSELWEHVSRWICAVGAAGIFQLPGSRKALKTSTVGLIT